MTSSGFWVFFQAFFPAQMLLARRLGRFIAFCSSRYRECVPEKNSGRTNHCPLKLSQVFVMPHLATHSTSPRLLHHDHPNYHRRNCPSHPRLSPLCPCAAAIHQQFYVVIDLLNQQARVLKRLVGKRSRPTNDKHRRLAALTRNLDRRILEAQELIVIVDTFPRWHRQQTHRTPATRHKNRSTLRAGGNRPGAHRLCPR